MATLEQLQQALIAADKAGASDDARQLAQAIIAIRQAPVAAQEKPAVPVEDPGLGMSVLIGAGRTFDRVGKGMQQLYYGAKSQFESPTLSSLVTGKTPSQIKLDQLKADAESDDKYYKPLAEARPFATGLGEALPSMVIPAGGGATLLANAGRLAAAGAIPGALEYGTVGERAGRAAVGAAAGAAVPALAAVGRTAKGFLEPLYQSGREKIAGRLLNRVVGDESAQVLDKLRGPRLASGGYAGPAELVPGSLPTAAQVAESGGIAALERAAAQANPEAYTRRGMEQASARLQALRGIAGDDATMAAAKAAREVATKDAYQAATGASYAIDGELADLLKRPVMQKAMARAKDMAENQGRPFQLMPNIPKDPLLAAGGIQRQAMGANGVVTGQGLQDLKMAIDAMLVDPAAGIAGKEGDVVKGLRGKLIDWMEQRNPDFKAARTQYADLSKPIDQMKVGQLLMNKAAPALSDYGALGKETGATFATALRNADQTVKSATGFKGNTGGLDGLMTPQQMAVLNGIGRDLARKANAQDLGRGVGADTFQKIAMSNIAEQSGMPRMMGGLLSVPGVNRATRWIYEDADQKMQGLLADALLNPQQTAKLMDGATRLPLPNNPKTRKLIEQALLRSGLLAAPASSSLAD